VEFKDKKVARSVAEMLNAQPIGGKKGSRWRDDVWTMKYLPKFKWNMLTEQVGECAAHFHQMLSDSLQLMKLRSILRNYESNYPSQEQSRKTICGRSSWPECWRNEQRRSARRATTSPRLLILLKNFAKKRYPKNPLVVVLVKISHP